MPDPTSLDRAVRAVVDGDTPSLRALLAAEPDLVRARSTDGFEATLLHFVAANGVPDELQRTPANAVEVYELLLAAGAAPDALAASYGGGPNQTPLCLLVSSWPPHERGVQADLVRALVAGGAGAAVDAALGTCAPPIPRELRHAPAPLLQEALHFALTHGRRTTAELLTSRAAQTSTAA